ncbi:MAG: YeeE/YedE family protein [Deltaproteobacteria bacterium]|nr:MAG: YeeE/YedE family protein [Deltaproteobacteria bacterium]
MEISTVIAATLGGALIGLSASAMLLLNGRIAGISGIVGGALKLPQGDMLWRVLFVAGLFTGGLVMWLVHPGAFVMEIDRSVLAIAVAGLLVGVGVRLGSGCTSGHGVCGLSRFSPRSLVATLTFMAAGAAVAAVVTQVFGGAL